MRAPRPNVEIVTIGEELLLGETVDGNAAWLGRRLAELGLRVVARATVGDDAAAIRDAVSRALERTGTVLCTGGLGPTRDDLTRPAVAQLFERELRLDPDLLEALRARFEARGVAMPAANRVQAGVPAGARPLTNARGTAPGLVLEDPDGRMAILLPGVPFEMRAMVEEHVLPLLAARWPDGRRAIRHRVVRTTGIAESALAERIDDLVGDLGELGVAFLPSPTGVDVRLTSWGGDEADAAEEALEAAAARIAERLGTHVYGKDGEDLTDVVARVLSERGWTVAVAESCTGGLLAKRLTDRPGASGYLLGGVVAYADAAKRDLLGVAPATLARHGAVSEETARAMAEGVRRRFSASVGVSITGLAGPSGGTAEKPVGTVWMAVASEEGTRTRRERFPGDRAEVRERSAQAALDLVRKALIEAPA